MSSPDARGEVWDAIIVGGGPAGLSAALMLGRCRRKVLLFDDGRPRNAASAAAHGLFTRDGASPEVLLHLGREQLAQYGVRVVFERVLRVKRPQALFEVDTGTQSHRARKLLLATGIVDRVPTLEGVAELYGRSVFHCPLCDGWEVRDRALAVHGQGPAAVELALALTVWSRDLVLCSDGWNAFTERERDELGAHDIQIINQKIRRLEGERGMLRQIVFEEGGSVARDALFFCAGTEQRSPLIAQLGCELDAKGSIKTGHFEEAGMPGLYVVGDASEDVKFIAVAVAEGVKAACSVNRTLRQEDTRARVALYRAAISSSSRSVSSG